MICFILINYNLFDQPSGLEFIIILLISRNLIIGDYIIFPSYNGGRLSLSVEYLPLRGVLTVASLDGGGGG